MIRVYLDGLGLRAPGIEGWASGCGVLAGETPYVPAAIIIPECELLPPAERRRTVPSIKLALAVAHEAVLAAGGDRANLATTFASSAGDTRTLHEIMQTLTTPTREVSPTRFHNSVHNAPAGYWHIASGCREASTSISCFDASFAAGLLEAGVQVATEGRAVLLVAYDLPHLAPLDAVRPIDCSFGAALHLTPSLTARSIAGIEIELVHNAPRATRMENPLLEKCRAGNPAARSLPILKLVAQGGSNIVYLDYVAGNSIAVSVTFLRNTNSSRGGVQDLKASLEKAVK